ncbi:MAG: cellulose synthase catalytic subunit, partial [Cyanobacteria bacterium J06629_18]
ILRTGTKEEFPVIRVRFPLVTVPQHRRLVQMLFCRPGQWKRGCTPGELESFILLFKILLKPRILFDRKVDVNAVAVSKV